VNLELLGVGEGTRSLAQRRVVLDLGMTATEEFRVSRRSAGQTASCRCQVRLRTEAGIEGRVRLRLDSEVSQGLGERSRQWQRHGEAGLFPGTSSMLEIAPEEAPGERLVLSMTVEEATGESITLRPVRVDLEVTIIGIGENGNVLLDRARLRTLTERPARYAFDYPVPSTDGESFDHVGLELALTPGFPRGGRIPLRLELAGGFPSVEGPVEAGRDESTTLAAGQTWTLDLRPPSGEGPGLRLAVSARWGPPAFDGSRGGPL
jgi:hypothetical protein